MIKYNIKKAWILASLIITAMLSTAVAAEIEEIIVTATKREQSLQDVSLSVTAISGDTLEEFSISNFYDMDIPGVNIAQGGMNDNAFIRGIGQSSGNFGFENSAPYYIDGVYFGRARASRLAWLDPERVEVLKGPVPTYLGKNASAGGISISSRRPTEEFEGFIDVFNEFQHSELAVNAAVSGPLSDNFRVRVAGKFRDLSDGWMHNVSLGVDEPRQEDTLFRVSGEWDITEKLTAYAKYENVDAQWFGRNTQQANCAANAVIDPVVEDCIFNETRASIAFPNLNHADIWDRQYPDELSFINDFQYNGMALILEWDLGAAVLTSTTSQYEFDNTFFADASHSSFDRALAEFDEHFEQTSQEIRITSSADDGLEWMAGVYYDTNENINTTRNSLPIAMGMIVFRDNDEDADSYGVFGEVGFDLTGTVKAKVGGRYSSYEKVNTYDSAIWVNLVPGQGPEAAMAVGMATFTINDNVQEASKFQPSLTVEWRPNDDTMYYVSAKEGFKAGALNHQTTSPDPAIQQIQPEEVTAIELGAKWTLMDGRARVNVALFDAEYENYQTSLFDPVALAFVVGNAGAASTQGIEIDAQYAATNNLTLGAYVSLLDAKWDQYSGVNCYLNPRQTVAEGCVEVAPGRFAQDLSGTPLQFAPDYSATLTANYNKPINENLEFSSTISLFVTDDYVLSVDGDPGQRQDSYAKLDARLGVGSLDGKWSLALIGRNLNDEHVLEWIGNAPGSPGQASDFALLKRTQQIALQGVYRFGK